MTDSATNPVPAPPTGWPSARRIRVPLGFLFAIFYFYVAHRRGPRSLWAWRSPLWVPHSRAGVWTIHKNEQLTTSGPYAYAQLSFISGSFIIALGFAVASRVWIAAVMVVLAARHLLLSSLREDFLGSASRIRGLRSQRPPFPSCARRTPQRRLLLGPLSGIASITPFL
jgi:hypothetical protein